MESILRDDGFPAWVDQVVNTMESAPLDYDSSNSLRLATATDWQERVTLVAGDLPSSAPGDANIEAVISELAANE